MYNADAILYGRAWAPLRGGTALDEDDSNVTIAEKMSMTVRSRCFVHDYDHVGLPVIKVDFDIIDEKFQSFVANKSIVTTYCNKPQVIDNLAVICSVSNLREVHELIDKNHLESRIKTGLENSLFKVSFLPGQYNVSQPLLIKQFLQRML